MRHAVRWPQGSCIVCPYSVRGEKHPHFLPHARWIWEFRRIPMQIVTDCGLLIAKLTRMALGNDRRTGRFERAVFRVRGAGAHVFVPAAGLLVLGAVAGVAPRLTGAALLAWSTL